jgi:tetratricopeptide (TPR) repeat protein
MADQSSMLLQDSDYKEELEEAFSLYQGGSLEAAAAICQRILDTEPDQQDCLYLSALMLRAGGKPKQALEYLERRLALRADHSNAHYLGALCHFQLQDYEAAMEADKLAIEADPRNAAAFNNLGLCHFARGNVTEAADNFTAAIGLNPTFAEAYHNLGVVLISVHKLNAAIGAFMKALEIKPDYFSALSKITGLLEKLSHFDKARAFVERAIEARPDSAPLRSVLAYVLYMERDYDASLAEYRKVMEIDPALAEAHEGMACVLRDIGMVDEALHHFERAVELAPENARIHNSMRGAMKQYGRTDDAEHYLRRALALDNTLCQAYYNLSMVKASSLIYYDLVVMEHLYASPRTLVTDRVLLGYAIANFHEKRKNYDQFFECLLRASALKRKTIKFNLDVEVQGFAGMKKIFDGQLHLPVTAESDDFSPIFIVGMPRSGTSLTEQILASHPQVYGAGERHYLGDLWKEALGEAQKASGPEGQKIEADRMLEIGQAYVEKIRKMAPGARYITDKMPENFVNLGLIRALWPNAPVIHTRRNPLDTCVSIFSKQFSNEGHRYSYDLAELGGRYVRYLDIMDHWRKAFPGQFYEIQYESLIDDTETEIRKLLAYCQLDFHADCLNFHENDRVVQTASSQQVKQPIYRSSVDAWRRYEKYLDPLIEAIGRGKLRELGVAL